MAGVLESSRAARARLAIRGSAWVAIEYGTSQIFRLASTLLLARFLLGPEAFGFVALVNVFLAGLEMLSDLGVGPNVVQHPRGDDVDFLNTAFTIQASRALFLWAAASALAYPFALFYRQPELFPLALAAAVGVALRGFASPSVWILSRQVQRGRLTLLTLAGEGTGFAVAMVWALVVPSAAALVAGTVSNAAVFSLGSYLILPWHRVRRAWDRRAAADILRFGAWISVATGTHFLAGQGERLVLGKFVTAAELGCFAIALMIATAPSRGLEQMVGQVFFPLIAKRAREDPQSTARYYLNARFVFLGVSLVLMAAFIGFSRWLVNVLLPPEYAMAGPMLQLLGARAAFDVFGAPAAALLLASGLSVYSATGNIVRLLFLSGGLYIAFSRFGLHEAVWVLAMSPIALYFPAIVIGMVRHFNGLVIAELVSFLAFLVSGGLMVFAWRMLGGG